MTPILVACSFIASLLGNRDKEFNGDNGLHDFDVFTSRLKEVFPELKDTRKKCRYNFSKFQPENYICDNEFECSSCHIHRSRLFSKLDYIEDLPVTADICGFKFKTERHYHRGHLYARIMKNALVKVGVSPLFHPFISQSLPEEYPIRHHIVEQDEFFLSMNIGHNIVIPFLSPISGEILSINREYSEKEPWLAIVKPFNLNRDFQSLLYGEEAKSWFKNEINSFQELLFPQGEFAADGGELNLDAINDVNNIPWKDLIFNFLLSGM